MHHRPIANVALTLFAALVLGLPAPPAAGLVIRKHPPGTVPVLTHRTVGRTETHSLEPFFTGSGALFLSVDGIGTALSTGTIEIEKPPGGQVKKAFLVASSSGYSGRVIGDGDVWVDDHPVGWDRIAKNAVGSWNALSDVTNLVKAAIDDDPSRRIALEIWERASDRIDGVVLAVVFEDPGRVRDVYVALYFGAQAPDGDRFVIELHDPVSGTVDRDYRLGLGISYGLQTSTERNQYTSVDINGRRLTTSAGGPDDGSPLGGALLTVGGLGDDAGNPTDALAGPVDLASDDEYYDLGPFLRIGDTQIEVATQNPSGDENLFFAAFSVGNSAARPGEAAREANSRPAIAPGPPVQAGSGGRPDDIVLSASSTESRLGTECEVTAVVRSGGMPVGDADVRLRIVSGPHAGVVAAAHTDSAGAAAFRYRGAVTGRDMLMVVVDENGPVAGSNILFHEWLERVVTAFIDIAPGVCPNAINPDMQDLTTIALLGSEDFDVDEVDLASLFLGETSPVQVQYRDVSRPAEGACGCSDEGGDGHPDLVLRFRTADVIPDASDVDQDARRDWVLTGRLRDGTRIEGSNCVVVSRTLDRSIELPDDVLLPFSTEAIDVGTE